MVLLIDVSRSMAAEDAVPDRLGVAVESASSLLRAMAWGVGDRSAVVAFAGRGVVRCPLTSNLDAALRILRSLQAGEVEPGGTDLGAALDVALDAFDEEEHADGRTIVVFSDGEDHTGSWPATIDRLRAGRVVVHSVAIGDPDRGHPLPPGSRPPREGDPEIESRRSDEAFLALSKATGGAMVPLGLASVDLGSLYLERIEPTSKRRRDELRVPERTERFPIFVLGAIVCILVGSWPGLSRGRGRGRRLGFAILAVGTLVTGAGSSGESASGLITQGVEAYQKGQFAEALNAFERAVPLEPTSPIPRFNAAAALYQIGRHPEAIRRYEEARKRGDASLSIKIDYALGNAQLALGNVSEAIARYDACVRSTHRGRASEAVRRDASANREFALARLKPPPEPAGSDGRKPPGEKQPRPKDGSPKGEDGSNSESDRPSTGDGATATFPSNSGKKGAGGAGGDGQPPPSSGSPESQLDAALKEIREARRQRPPDPPPPSSRGVGKDW